MRSRTYAMENRAEAAARTREAILQAAYDLWLTDDYDDVSLERVAARAGVSKQTVIRSFGAKDQLACAVVDWQRPREEAARVIEPGDLNAAVDVLVARYEEIGDANVRLLALEQRVPAIRYLLEQARESHSAWIEHAFAPYLPKRNGAARRRRLMAFYAATEVMLWKLIRRDLQQSRTDVHAIFLDLVSGLASRSGAT
jgi:AcrR family transcriptional regulator